MALGSTQTQTEMSTRNLPCGKGRTARRADNLTAIYESIVWKMWEPRCLPFLRASTAFFKGGFTCIFFGRNIVTTHIFLEHGIYSVFFKFARLLARCHSASKMWRDRPSRSRLLAFFSCLQSKAERVPNFDVANAYFWCSKSPPLSRPTHLF
jgi:hypothetical protein